MELIKAMSGGKGALDAWLECHNEDDVREAILALASPAETLRDKLAATAMTVFLRNALDNEITFDGFDSFDDVHVHRARPSPDR